MFFFAFLKSVNCKESTLKTNITPFGEKILLVNLLRYNLSFWESFLPLRNYRMDFRFSGNAETLLEDAHDMRHRQHQAVWKTF